MLRDFPLVLSPRASQSLSKLLNDVDGHIIQSSQDLHGHRRKNNALSCACLAILTDLLLIAMGESVTRLNSSTVNKLGLEA